MSHRGRQSVRLIGGVDARRKRQRKKKTEASLGDLNDSNKRDFVLQWGFRTGLGHEGDVMT